MGFTDFAPAPYAKNAAVQLLKNLLRRLLGQQPRETFRTDLGGKRVFRFTETELAWT